ncbi:MAG: hypothetical protein M3P91_09790 [Actinomycetota bacterium]|nr:hypothetical protein [Actinomycetota bacterium]
MLALTVSATVLFSGAGLAQAAPAGPASGAASAAAVSSFEVTKKGKVPNRKEQHKAAAAAKVLAKDKQNALRAAVQVEKDLGRVTMALNRATALTEPHRTTMTAGQAAVLADVQVARQAINAATTRAAVAKQSTTLRTLRGHAMGVGRAVQVVDKADDAVVDGAQTHAELLAAVEEAQLQGKDLTALNQRIDATVPALAEATAALVAAADSLAAGARYATGSAASKVSRVRDAHELVGTDIEALTLEVLALLDPVAPSPDAAV